MTDNFSVIREKINNILHEIYTEMNKYLEYVLNLPSTINRIVKYYAIGSPDNPTIHEWYIMFGGTIVRKYVIELDFNPWWE